MRQNDVIRFQKTLALAANASTPHEAEAAELAARRVMQACNLDPTRIPNGSFYSHHNFADSPLLAKLREEYRAAHPASERRTKVTTAETPDLNYLNSPKISFSMNRYQRVKQGRSRRSPTRRAKVVVTPQLLEAIHAMLRDDVAPVMVRRKFNLTKGQIAGIKSRYDQANAQNSQHQQTATAPARDADDSSAEQA